MESIKSRGNRSRLSIKGGREADVRPHTDNSTECSMEFMRFNPLRNPREAALVSSPSPSSRSFLATVYGGFQRVKDDPDPTAGVAAEGEGEGEGKAARRRRRVQRCKRKKAHRLASSCLIAKERALTPANKTRGVA